MASDDANKMASDDGNKMVSDEASKMATDDTSKMVSDDGSKMVSDDGNKVTSDNGNQMVSDDTDKVANGALSKIAGDDTNDMASDDANKMATDDPKSQVMPVPHLPPLTHPSETWKDFEGFSTVRRNPRPHPERQMRRWKSDRLASCRPTGSRTNRTSRPGGPRPSASDTCPRGLPGSLARVAPSRS
ncbi:hypothetical protein B0T18DRAFT_417078 [Schizothecium vesticola]|uniref:Uncharacterized protein n=1 Tax=Schizothecium vesticola TaxID=314040 RepID=A0AA40EFT0_9PEZI|nr:hypothetical protein B0T18DRAFT_417078 [Schizothecium vesticola]